MEPTLPPISIYPQARPPWSPKHSHLPSPLMTNFVHTNKEKVELVLYNILRRISAPLYAWDLIMKWGKYAQSVQYDFATGNSIKKFINKLCKDFNMEGMKPFIQFADIDYSGPKDTSPRPRLLRLYAFQLKPLSNHCCWIPSIITGIT